MENICHSFYKHNHFHKFLHFSGSSDKVLSRDLLSIIFYVIIIKK